MTATRLSRRFLLAGLTASLASPALIHPALAEPMARSLRPPPRPGARPTGAARLVQAAKLGGVTGYVLLDAKTGALIEGDNADAPVPPASVAKAITALYALEKLGPGRRFRTRILPTGPVVGGIVQGDLILSGSGDPTLTTDDLGDLAAQLAGAGVRGVTGRFLAHDGALPRLTQLAADQPAHVGYNPALSGLNLNFNRVHFEWKRADADWRVTMDARAERFVPQVGMSSVRIVRREAPLFTYEPGEATDSWTVASGALGKGGSRWLPVRHPAVYTAEVFRTLAAAQGITLPDAALVTTLPATPGGEIAAHVSVPMDQVLRDMLRYSTNLTAECAGLAASGAGSLEGSGRVMTEWARQRLGMGSQFHDHSGLGAASRTTAADMARALLTADRASPLLRGILREIGMRDAAGKTVKDHPVRVMAKSGTLNFCSGLAGFIQPPGGRDMVFAIFSADVPRREALSPENREQPPGGPDWTRRARNLQGQLIARWAETYGA